MTQTFPQEWESRREIPNPQIRDVADQYEQARQILSMQPPGTGILLPLMNTASMAIELYLKCLAGEGSPHIGRWGHGGRHFTNR